MKTRAAVLSEMGRPRPYAQSRPLVIEEVELDPPAAGEVIVRMRAAGLCHSDLSVINGDRPRPMPMIIGHEGAGEIVEVGAGVRDLLNGKALSNRNAMRNPESLDAIAANPQLQAQV